MINPSTVNPLFLPSVPLEERSHLPNTSAIYFAIDSDGTVLYIGRSVNPSKRWAHHQRYYQLEAIGGIKIAYLTVDTPEMLPSIERALIAWFKPLLNKSEVKGRGYTIVRRTVDKEVPELGKRIKEAREADGRSRFGDLRRSWYISCLLV